MRSQKGWRAMNDSVDRLDLAEKLVRQALEGTRACQDVEDFLDQQENLDRLVKTVDLTRQPISPTSSLLSTTSAK